MVVLRAFSAGLMVLAACAAAAAQTPPAAPRGFIAVKAGTMHENAEDGLRQTSGALGFSGGLRLSRQWMLEADFADNGMGSPDHREGLFSVSALRWFRDSGARPYLALGLTVGRNEETRTACFAWRTLPDGGAPVRALVDCSEPDVYLRVPETFTGGTSYLLVGSGLMIPLWRKTHLAPEFRVHLSATSIIVRPSVGLAIVF